MTTTPSVDVIVPVHSAERPIGRAVESALHDARLDPELAVRVVVVCHGVDPQAIAAALPEAARTDPRIHLEPFADGIASPAGPVNHGLSIATADYVSRLDSDDALAPGALAAWVALAREHGSAVVVARQEMMSGRLIATPRVRPRRALDLEVERDRLAYRTAPFGLLRRELVERLGLRMTEGIATGEDLAFTARLWTSGERIDLARTDPAYLVGEDAGDRVTSERRPVADDLAAVDLLLCAEWFRALRAPVRRAIAVKLLRVHVIGAVLARREATHWSADDVRAAATTARACLDAAPGVERAFTRADRALLDALTGAGCSAASLPRAVGARLSAGRVDTWLPPRLLDVVDRESALRYLVANAAWR